MSQAEMQAAPALDPTSRQPEAAESSRPALFRSGWLPVYRKELADHFSSRRFLILFLVVAAASLAALYTAAQTIRGSAAAAGDTGFVFLLLYTTTDGSLPSLLQFLSFLGPLAGLALGFDAINGEWSRRTLSRVLAQPIHRDAVINGKFLAGLSALALIICVLGLLMAGLGLRLIGIPPTGEEAMRIFLFLLLTIIYVGFWLALSILFSLCFRQAATSALAGMSVWLLFVLFWELLAGLAAGAIAPVSSAGTPGEVLANSRWFLGLARISPAYLYTEATATILRPDVRALGPVLTRQMEGAVPGAPLPLEQSLLLIMPHLAGLIAACTICFALAYILFMRQEIRAN